MAEEKVGCSTAKEIIIYVLLLLYIAKVKLTLFSTYILCIFKHQCFSTFTVHFLNSIPHEYRCSLIGGKQEKCFRISNFSTLQNLLLLIGKPTLRFETMDSRPSMISPFSKEKTGEIALVS